jgi:predicted XRE-type DNA-binding protein
MPVDRTSQKGDRMANNDIKTFAKKNGVKHWEIADKLNMHDSNFSKMLRHELPEAEKEKIRSVIKVLATNKKERSPKRPENEKY